MLTAEVPCEPGGDLEEFLAATRKVKDNLMARLGSARMHGDAEAGTAETVARIPRWSLNCLIEDGRFFIALVPAMTPDAKPDEVPMAGRIERAVLDLRPAEGGGRSLQDIYEEAVRKGHADAEIREADGCVRIIVKPT